MTKIIIDDVAAKAGVSIKTVSRVMNREQNVRPVTRDKVLAAAQALNYKPNQSARGLAGNKTFLIALVYDNPNPSYLTNIQRGILETCEAEGYGMVLKPVSFDGDQTVFEQVSDFMAHSKVDGLVLTPPVCDDTVFKQELIEYNIPYVSVAPPDQGDKLAVLIDDMAASQEMMQHLLALGHTHIAFIKGHPAHGAGKTRYNGYEKALEAANLPLREELIYQGYFTFDCGLKAADYFMSLPTRPTAIYGASDEMAAGVVHYLQQKGLAVPSDISVVGFDDTPISKQIWPPMTTVHQPIRTMGRVASKILIADICKQENDPVHQIPYRLEFRNSSATVKG